MPVLIVRRRHTFRGLSPAERRGNNRCDQNALAFAEHALRFYNPACPGIRSRK